jgi:hypothetical protein
MFPVAAAELLDPAAAAEVLLWAGGLLELELELELPQAARASTAAASPAALHILRMPGLPFIVMNSVMTTYRAGFSFTRGGGGRTVSRRGRR